MKSIFFITGIPLDLVEIGIGYKHLGDVTVHSKNRIVVEGVWGWFAFNTEPDGESEFDTSELAFVKRSFPKPFYFQLEYSSNKAAELAVSYFSLEIPFLIDNDFGLILTVEQVKARIALGRSWLSKEILN